MAFPPDLKLSFVAFSIVFATDLESDFDSYFQLLVGIHWIQHARLQR